MAKKIYCLFRNIISILYINFKKLPLNQAIKLPILLYNPKIDGLKGEIRIESDNVEFGMIQLGEVNVGMYRKNGIVLQLFGSITFKGKCNIGSSTFLSIGENGHLVVGNNFVCNSGSRIICYHNIVFEDFCNIGWDVQIIDTDFHSIKNLMTGKKVKPYSSIYISKYCWIGNSCFINKGTKLPPNTIVSSGSLVNKKFKCEENSIIGGNPATVMIEGCYYRDRNDDKYDGE